MIGRGYESRDLTAGSSRNASPTNHPGHPSPPPAPRLSTRRSPVSSDCLRHPPPPPPPRHSPDTPQHRPSQPSRIPVPHSSLFIHPSCTPSPWHRHWSRRFARRRFARRRRHHRRRRRRRRRVSVLLHRADTPGVLNGIVATLLLATSKCRRRRLRGRRRRQRSRPSSLSLSLSLSLIVSLAPASVRCSAIFVCGSIDASASGDATLSRSSPSITTLDDRHSSRNDGNGESVTGVVRFLSTRVSGYLARDDKKDRSIRFA